MPSARVRATMSSAVEAISCPKVDVPAGPEPREPAKEAAPPAEHCDTAPNGKCAPRCHGEEEADEDEEEEEEEKAPKAIDLGPMVSIKEQLEKDKVRTVPCLNSSACVSFLHYTSSGPRFTSQDDESLRRWKEQLLGGVDLNSVGGKTRSCLKFGDF